MSISESGENYLEAILILSREQRIVRSVDVAGLLGVTKPSVSRAISNLRADGFVEMQTDGGLCLTESGLAAAKSVYERHEVLTEFLVTLGVAREVAAEDACRIEHVISEESFNMLRRHAKEQVSKRTETKEK